jgi:uncharacterized membrane protein YqjE
MEEAKDSKSGTFVSLGRLLKTFVAVAHNRLELLLTELQEERWRFYNIALLLGAALILAMMTLLVATMTLVVFCLEQDRLDLLVGLVLAYLVATVICFWRLIVQLKNWAPFSATLSELKKDKECLEEEN